MMVQKLGAGNVHDFCSSTPAVSWEVRNNLRKVFDDDDDVGSNVPVKKLFTDYLVCERVSKVAIPSLTERCVASYCGRNLLTYWCMVIV